MILQFEKKAIVVILSLLRIAKNDNFLYIPIVNLLVFYAVPYKDADGKHCMLKN